MANLQCFYFKFKMSQGSTKMISQGRFYKYLSLHLCTIRKGFSTQHSLKMFGHNMPCRKCYIFFKLYVVKHIGTSENEIKLGVTEENSAKNGKNKICRLKPFLKNLSAFLDLNFDDESIKSFFNLLLHFLVNFEFRRNNFFWRQIVIEKSNSKTYPEKNVRVQKIYIIWMGEKIIGVIGRIWHILSFLALVKLQQ